MQNQSDIFGHEAWMDACFGSTPKRYDYIKSVSEDLYGILFDPGLPSGGPHHSPKQLCDLLAILVTENPAFKDSQFTEQFLTVLSLFCRDLSAK